MFNASPVCLRLRSQLALIVQQIRQLDVQRANYQRWIAEAERRSQEDPTRAGPTGQTARLEHYRPILARIETQRRGLFNEFDQLHLRFQRECGAEHPLPADVHR